MNQLGPAASPSTRDLQLDLKQHFGLEEFRPLQEPIIQAMIDGRDLLAVMGTGGGKSLCFQLPALIYQEGVTLVVSPTIALMADQIQQINARGVVAVTFNSTIEKEDIDAGWDLVNRGVVKLIYLSPEHLATARFYEALGETKVNRIVIDEAHCISCWGHDFRADYQKIPLARERLGNPPIAAFTATAPVRVRDDMLAMLGIPEAEQFIGEVDRPELSFDVERFDWHAKKVDRLFELLNEYAAKNESVIVYANTIRTLDTLLKVGEEARLPVGIYHGQLLPHVKDFQQRRFLSGETKILFATKAFGMGINKPDVRAVIHYEPSESLEGFYQEAGRAGRDGVSSRSFLLYTAEDLVDQRSRLRKSEVSLEVISHVYNWLWGRSPKDKPKEVGTVIPFVPVQFAKSIAKDDETFEGKILAAIAHLNEFGYISAHSGRCQFLKGPEDFADDSDAYARVKERYNAKLRQLKVMELYLTSPDPRALILGYFRFDDPDIDNLEVNWSVTLNDDQVASIIKIAADTNPSVTQVQYAVSRGTSPSINPKYLEPFPRMTPGEQELALAAAENLGVISRFQRGKQSLIFPTTAGLHFLQERGEEVKISTFDDVKPRMLNPDVRSILREAIGQTFRSKILSYETTIPWKFIVGSIMKENFKIFDKDVSGAELAGTFHALSRKDMKDEKLVLEAGNNLLNYLFDNVVGRSSADTKAWLERGEGETTPSLDSLA